MVGRKARNAKTGELYGTIVRDHGSSWYIQTLGGKHIDILKDLVTIDAEPEAPFTIRPHSDPNGTLIILNQIMGLLCLLGGIIGLIMLWPESRRLSAGYEYTAAAYLPAIVTGISGFISCLIFFNFAALLRR
jgi:hypothetical protein